MSFSTRLALSSALVFSFWGPAALAQSATVHGNRVTVTDGTNKVDVDQAQGNRVKVTDGASQVEIDDGQGNRVKVTTGAKQANTSTESVNVQVHSNARKHEPQREPARDLEPLTIAGNDEHVKEDCAGRDVAISGNNLKVKLRGECAKVEVTGSDNTVDIDTVASIEVVGSANKVTWVTAPRDARPRISKTGSDNEVNRRHR